MRLAVYDDHRVGVLADDGTIVDLTDLVAAHVEPLHRMTKLIEGWDALRPTVIERHSAGGGVPEHAVTLRAPQPRPVNLIAAPINYHKHQQEMGGSGGVYQNREILGIELRKGFFKAVTSIVGPDGAIVLPTTEPYHDRRYDHEAEIGVVIGKAAKDVPLEKALDHVFAYVPIMDITLRGEEDRSWRKSMDTFTPIGPYLVTADEVPDAEDIDFWLTVNGEERQRSNARLLVWGVAKLIHEYSKVVTLQPGDVIATGTPEGVGEIKPGDTVVLTLDGIGELAMPVEAKHQ